MVCLRLPAAGFQQCSSRLPHWRSAQTMRMCSAMAQEQVSQHSLDKCLLTFQGPVSQKVENLSMLVTSAHRLRAMQQALRTFSIPGGSHLQPHAFLAADVQEISKACLHTPLWETHVGCERQAGLPLTPMGSAGGTAHF